MKYRNLWQGLMIGWLVVLGGLAERSAEAQNRGPVSAGGRTLSPSLDAGSEWLNTASPIDLKDLRGKFVILDFWTYCCINCMHILPELKKLEHAHPDHLVVIGVHSGKFDNERDAENIRQAILRHDIEHPVVNDPELRLWKKFNVRMWPTLQVIDPEGYLIARHEGEATFEMLDGALKRWLPLYRRKGVLDDKPLRFDLERDRVEATPLRFPGKVLADPEGDRLFIADTSHNRIVIARLDGTLLDVVGRGEPGHQDGPYDQATFDHPQGMALHGERLYVADTENHLLRQIDLNRRRVATVAGTGRQARTPARGPTARARGIHLASPWDLWIHDEELYIAMAGPHQIWKMSLGGRTRIGPYAGNAIEDVVDGPLLPRVPQQEGFSSFAQPSGLASDGQWLYVADSEGSSIRAVPLQANQQVKTVLGTAGLSQNRLFTFGDRDGPLEQALLQHPLCVAYHNGRLFVADAYNHKIKELSFSERTIRTVAGDGQAGGPPRFQEPGGLSLAGDKLYVADTNNHLIRVIHLQPSYRVDVLEIEGLTPPQGN